MSFSFFLEKLDKSRGDRLSNPEHFIWNRVLISNCAIFGRWPANHFWHELSKRNEEHSLRNLQFPVQLYKENQFWERKTRWKPMKRSNIAGYFDQLRKQILSYSFRQYSRTCPCDHLTKATTWKLRTHNFSPFISRIQMYGLRSWKGDHLRNANCGHQRSAQSVDSTREKRPHTSIERKAIFCLSDFSFRRRSKRAIIAFTSSTCHGRCQLRTRLTRGSHQSLMLWLAQGHVYNSILKNFEPNPANETTWKIGPHTPSPFGGRNSQVWLYFRSKLNKDTKTSFSSELQFWPNNHAWVIFGVFQWSEVFLMELKGKTVFFFKIPSSTSIASLTRWTFWYRYDFSLQNRYGRWKQRSEYHWVTCSKPLNTKRRSTIPRKAQHHLRQACIHPLPEVRVSWASSCNCMLIFITPCLWRDASVRALIGKAVWCEVYLLTSVLTAWTLACE